MICVHTRIMFMYDSNLPPDKMYMYAYNMKIKLLLGVFTYKPVEFSAMEDDADADDDPVLDPGKVSATIMHKDFKTKCVCTSTIDYNKTPYLCIQMLKKMMVKMNW